MKNTISSIVAILRPASVILMAFVLLTAGTVNSKKYGGFLQTLQASSKLSDKQIEDVLAETDSIDDFLITFNYETIFAQPVEFLQDITAPNVLYSLIGGDGISLSGDAQKPRISNTGVLSVNGLKGDVTFKAGENVTFVEENGVLTIKSTYKDTDTDTKLTKAEVKSFAFDGESTGKFNELQIGDILLSQAGTLSTTSGSSLVGVYQGNLTEISGTNVQEVIDSIDSTLTSLGTSSHGEVTFAGSLDYLTLTGQQITLNQIDLTTDVSGMLPIVNGGTGANTAPGARTNLGLVIGTDIQGYDSDLTTLSGLSNADGNFIVGSPGGWVVESNNTARSSLGLGTGDTVSFATLGVGTTNPAVTLDVQGAAQFGSGNVDLINSTGKIAAINTTYFASVDGSALTNLDATELSTGTVPSARISGLYTGITGVGTLTAGTWQGSVINAAYLDSATIISTEIDTYSELNTIVSDVTLTHNGLIDTSAEIAAIVTNETGSGALVFGTSPSLTTPNIGAASGTSLTLSGALTTGGIITGTGSGLTGLNASNLSSGTVPDARITGSYTGLTSVTGSGTATFASFSGNGSSLTNLNASNLATGSVASARISGSYTGITGVGTIGAGTWQGSAISSTYLDTSVILSSEIDTSAELAAIVTNETGSGALVFGTSPTLTTPNIGAANGTSLTLTGALTSGGIITGTGSGLSGLNASNLASGTVASARISGSYTGITGTGALNAGSITSGFGNINIGTSTFTGNGSGLTTLNASNLSSGTVADARITGSYTGLTNITGSGTSTFESFLLSSNGNRTTPAIRWASDTNMGIYRGGTDILRFATAGADRLSILANGNVGIGTTNPSYALQVGGYTRFDNNVGIGMNPESLYRLAIKSPGPGYVPIYIQDNDSLNYLAAIDHEVTLGGRLGLWNPSGVQQVTINGVSSFILGNVAVGKSYASSFSGLSDSELFDVDGVLQTRSGTFQMGGDTYRRAAFYTGTSGDPYFMIYLANSGTSSTTYKRFEITSAGNIGIDMGVSSPTQKLDVNGNARIRSIGSSTYANVVNQTSDGTLTTATSDIRFKKDIETIDNALKKVMQMRGVTYNWIDASNKKRMTGMIAQEVQEVMPELVVQNPSDGYYGLFYGETAGLLVEAIKEQQSFIVTNQSTINTANIQINAMGEVLDIVTDNNQQLISSQIDLLNQINLVTNIQDTQNSSTSALLHTVTEQIKSLEKMTNDTAAVVQGLQDRVSQLENIFMTKTATGTALLAGSNEDNVLGALSDINVESLIVSGDTNINTLGVTGDITAGLLSIKGFDDELGTPSASISTISGPLKIQDQATGHLEIMGGKVLIDTEGNISVRGSITVEKLNIDEEKEESKSTGDGIITAGDYEVIIKTTAVTNSSRIFVTGKNVVKSPLTVTEKIAGESFTVHIAIPEEKDIKFDWLIVN